MVESIEEHRATLKAEDLGFGLEDEDALDVLDLPQLYNKPSAKILLGALHDLSSEPPSWETTRSGTPRTPGSGLSTPFRKKRKVKSEGVPRYLTTIISSSLGWIEDDSQKECVWEAASQRLSERSGRTAMGSITRTFVVPVHKPPFMGGNRAAISGISTADAMQLAAADDDLSLRLFEPALTADNLGLKTWASSYLLAKRMVQLKPVLPCLPKTNAALELGAGTGLVGLAASAILGIPVILTDLPEIVPNLEKNVNANAATIASYGGKADVAISDWRKPGPLDVHHAPNHPFGFSLIFAADPIYSREHPRLLVQAVQYNLSKSSTARVVIEMPLRDGYSTEREDFRARMEGIGLTTKDEGEEVGFDDWSSGQDDDELAEVRCWWTVWGWRT